ncbi:hypothetical protein D3C83_106950 [compost metagenome]
MRSQGLLEHHDGPARPHLVDASAPVDINDGVRRVLGLHEFNGGHSCVEYLGFTGQFVCPLVDDQVAEISSGLDKHEIPGSI